MLKQVACEFHFDKQLLLLASSGWIHTHIFIRCDLPFVAITLDISQVASFLYILFLKSKSSIPSFHTHQVPIGFPSTSPCQKHNFPLFPLPVASTHSPSRLQFPLLLRNWPQVQVNARPHMYSHGARSSPTRAWIQGTPLSISGTRYYAFRTNFIPTSPTEYLLDPCVRVGTLVFLLIIISQH